MDDKKKPNPTEEETILEIKRLQQEQQQAITNIKKNIKSQFNPFIEWDSDKEVPQDFSGHKRIKPNFWNNELMHESTKW